MAITAGGEGGIVCVKQSLWDELTFSKKNYNTQRILMPVRGNGAGRVGTYQQPSWNEQPPGMKKKNTGRTLPLILKQNTV